jgi:hypothetical protein
MGKCWYPSNAMTGYCRQARKTPRMADWDYRIALKQHCASPQHHIYGHRPILASSLAVKPYSHVPHNADESKVK